MERTSSTRTGALHRLLPSLVQRPCHRELVEYAHKFMAMDGCYVCILGPRRAGLGKY